MDHEGLDRRIFLKGAVVGGAAAVGTTVPQTALAQASPPAGNAKPAAAEPAPAGYTFLAPDEAAFIEAVVDHMIPADALTPKGTDLGINIYIDRALSSGWGKGDRLYRQGPWKQGTANQGYQSPLTPSEVYRAAIPAANAQCVKLYGKPFEKITAEQREAFLVALQGGKVTFENGPPVRAFFTMLYDNVMEGMFADPIYGGNRDKASWKMIGFGGVVAVHQQNVEKYRGQKFPVNPLGIADMS
jgi:gluconate 2-dehydrogenase gamma chain